MLSNMWDTKMLSKIRSFFQKNCMFCKIFFGKITKTTYIINEFLWRHCWAISPFCDFRCMSTSQFTCFVSRKKIWWENLSTGDDSAANVRGHRDHETLPDLFHPKRSGGLSQIDRQAARMPRAEYHRGSGSDSVRLLRQNGHANWKQDGVPVLYHRRRRLFEKWRYVWVDFSENENSKEWNSSKANVWISSKVQAINGWSVPKNVWMSRFFQKWRYNWVNRSKKIKVWLGELFKNMFHFAFEQLDSDGIFDLFLLFRYSISSRLRARTKPAIRR